MTLPLKRADTGPTFILATARKPLSSVLSSSSQPGMQAFSTSGSFSLAHTASRGAASCTSPFIVIAMRASPDRLALVIPQVKHARHKRKGGLGRSAMHIRSREKAGPEPCQEPCQETLPRTLPRNLAKNLARLLWDWQR